MAVRLRHLKGVFFRLACVLVLLRVRASQGDDPSQSQRPCIDDAEDVDNIANETDRDSDMNINASERDSGGDSCSYYAAKPHHCGCCDTAAFKASACCACQQSPVAGNSTWWTSVLQTWPGKARTMRLSGKGIQGQIPARIAERWPSLTEIDLSQNRLTGSLPPDLGGLWDLQHLDLHDNLLSGSLPPDLDNLTSLETLDLHDNRLSGNLPPELGELRSLQHLDLHSNRLSGLLPPELGSLGDLRTLRLDDNDLSGGIPAELGDLVSLQALNLNSNGLSGSLPAEFGQLLRLQELYLQSNKLSGSLPAELGHLSSLRMLYLYGNRLSGVIPPELGNLSSLQRLYLYNNELSGAIPAALGNLSSLQRLYLYDNELSGAIPAALGNLASLQQLDMEDNELRGTIPAALGNLASLQTLYLNDNELSGAIPAALGNLASLQLLYLKRNELSGAIPAALGNLTSLQRLYLYHNELSGAIPAALGNLASLQRLYLYNNKLSGAIPAALGNLASLQRLYLYNNKLSGAIPAALGNLASLQTLYLNNNELSGAIPAALGNLASLQLLYLDDNELSGAIPAALGNLSSLQRLYLYNNEFSGAIPAALGNLASVQRLYLYNNELSGAIPAALGNLASLQRLYLYKNKLSGAIPAALGNLTSLQRLDMEGNELSGAIPAALGNLTSLQLLDMEDNELGGAIPAALGNLTSLERLNLKDNRLNGSIPIELGNLTSLEWLELTGNQISGSIPSEIGNLRNLDTLQLYRNQLTGVLPPELGNLLLLEWMDVSNNQLSGPIPPEFGGLTRLRTIYFHANQFSGPIPPEMGNLSSIEILWLHTNQLSGPIPRELGNLMNLEDLNLRNNLLNGDIPPEFGSMESLLELILSNNQISGSLPPELGGLAALKELELDSNRLSGSLPPELGNLMNLEDLELQDNQLSGSLPPELGGLSSLKTLYLQGNNLTGALPASFRGLTSLKYLRASRNPLLCGGAEVIGELASLTRLDLRGCCFRDFAQLPVSLEQLDLGENLLTEVPRPWRQPSTASLSLRDVRLDGNRIAQWDTAAVVPLSIYASGSWTCGNRPEGRRFPWPQLQSLDVSRNSMRTPVYYFLASLSHLAQLNVLLAQEAGLLGTIPDLSSRFVPYVLNTGNNDCSDWPGVQTGFPALLTIDLSGNGITAIFPQPSVRMVQADLSRNALTLLSSQWWQGGLEVALQRLDVRGNPGLQLPVLLNDSSTCPDGGTTDLTANTQGWNARPDGRAECTTLCSMKQTRFLIDATVNESTLCRCIQGQGLGRNCTPCPQDTYSTISLESGQYIRSCQVCPANSKLRDKQGLCYADCDCLVGYYMAQLSNGSALDVGTTPCGRVAPEGRCLSCGVFKTSFQGSRKASDCFCNSNRSSGGWEGLIERQGECGCPDGFHMNFRERTCVWCLSEEDCVDWTKSLKPPSVKAGFWALPAPSRGSDGLFGNFSGHSIWRCLSTAACPGDSACGENLEGTACSLCRQGYFRTPSGGCTRCSRGYMETRLMLVAGLLACMVFPTLAHFQLRADMGEPAGLALALRSVRTSLKQMLKFAQILGLISLFGVEWPSVASSVFTGTRAFSLDFAAWLGVACLDSQQQESMPLMMAFRWMLPVAGVVVTCLAALLVTVSGHVLGPLCARCWARQEDRIRQLLRFPPLDILRVLVFFLALFFPSLLKNALLPLTCAPSPNGLLTMNTFPHIVCGEADFWAVAGLGIAQSALLSLGFPLVLFFAWQRIDNSRTMEVLKQRRRWWAFIFVDFRPQRSSWVLVATCKDIVLNLIVAVLPGLGTAQLLVTSVVSIIYACAVFSISPYPDASNTLLETCTASAVAALCLFTAGVGFQSEPDVPSLEVTIVGGRDGSGYAQRAISLVCLQGLSLVCPAAIVTFQLFMAFPRSRHCVPACVRPLSAEQREDWSEGFTRAMGMERGPFARALAELDSIEFAAFRQAVIRGRLSWRTLTMGVSSAGCDEVPDEEQLVPALHVKIGALHSKNTELSRENAALSSEITGLQAEIAGLQAGARHREEETFALRKEIEQLKNGVGVHHREDSSAVQEELEQLPSAKRQHILAKRKETQAGA